MASDFYFEIETRINKTCDAIHSGWYANCTQVISAYNMTLCLLKQQWNESTSKNT